MLITSLIIAALGWVVAAIACAVATFFIKLCGAVNRTLDEVRQLYSKSSARIINLRARLEGLQSVITAAKLPQLITASGKTGTRLEVFVRQQTDDFRLVSDPYLFVQFHVYHPEDGTLLTTDPDRFLQHVASLPGLSVNGKSTAMN